METSHKNMWLYLAAFLTLWSAWHYGSTQAIPLKDTVVTLFCLLFFYLSWICDLLQKNNKGFYNEQT